MVIGHQVLKTPLLISSLCLQCSGLALTGRGVWFDQDLRWKVIWFKSGGTLTWVVMKSLISVSGLSDVFPGILITILSCTVLVWMSNTVSFSVFYFLLLPSPFFCWLFWGLFEGNCWIVEGCRSDYTWIPDWPSNSSFLSMEANTLTSTSVVCRSLVAEENVIFHSFGCSVSSWAELFAATMLCGK